jgi:hypothetical protein
MNNKQINIQQKNFNSISKQNSLINLVVHIHSQLEVKKNTKMMR